MFTKRHIHNSPKLEITQIFINRTDFFNVVTSYNRTLQQRGRISKMKATKLETKEYLLYDFIYVKSKKQAKLEFKTVLANVRWGLRKEAQYNLQGNGMFSSFFSVAVTLLYTIVKTYEIVHLRSVNLITLKIFKM